MKFERIIENKIEVKPEEIEKINDNLSKDVILLAEKFAEKYALFLESFQGKFNSLKLKEGGFLGFGGSGTVFNINDEVCLKVMDNREKADNYHEYDLEARVAMDLNGLEVSGIRMPIFFSYYRTKNNREIVMEKINGVNLKNALDGKESFPKKFIDKYVFNGSFDIETIEDELNNFFEAVHDKGIYHGDIALRNIMINMDGNIVVIDTGRSGYLNENNKDEKISQDYKMLDDLIKELGYYDGNAEIEERVPVIHFNHQEDGIIENQIFDERILKIAEKYIRDNKDKLIELDNFLYDLYVAKDPKGLILGLKAILVDNEVYYIGFKMEKD